MTHAEENLKMINYFEHIGMLPPRVEQALRLLVKEEEVSPENCKVRFKKIDNGYSWSIEIKRVNE